MEEIKEKVNYCLNCKIKPCSVKGCPLENNIPDFIKAVKEEEYKKAYEILSKTTVLPGICGKICPHMKQCQGSCVRGIKGEPVNIGDIENFIFEKAEEENYSLKEAMQEAECTDTIKAEKISLPIQLSADNSPVIDPTHKYHPEGYVPDWEYMEKYIRAIEKLVIKDVVKYKDGMIEKMKEVI